MFSLRRAVGAVALTGAVFGFAACGSSAAPEAQDVTVDSSPIAVRHAAETTATQSTAMVDTTIAMTIAGKPVSMTGTGEMDPQNSRFKQQFDMTPLFAQLMTNAPPGAIVPFTVIADGPAVFVSFPGFGQLSGGKPWVKFDTASASDNSTNLLGTGGGAFTLDPTSFLRFLDGAGKTDDVGQESVRGTMTTHYRGTYTINDGLASLTSDERDRVTKQFDALGFPLNARDEPIDYDVWIGADGLVRRVSTTFDMATLAPNPSSTLGEMNVTVEYSDFGAPVDIQAPAADQVQDLSTLVSHVN